MKNSRLKMGEESKGGEPLAGRLKALISVLTLLCCAGIFYYLFRKYQFSFAELLNIPGPVLLSVIALVLFTLLLRGLTIRSLVKIFGVRLTFGEWYGLSIFRKYLNYLPFKGGTIAKGLYLKKCHNLPIALFLSVIGGFLVLFLLSNGILGLICWLATGKQGTDLEFVIPLAFAAFILIGVIFMVYSPDLSKRKSFLFRYLNKMYRGWELIRQDPKTVAGVTLLSVLITVIYSLRLLVLFHWQAVRLSFFEAIMIAILTNLVVIFVNLTPSALGIKEAVLIYSSSLMGVGMEACLYVAMIDRIIAVVVVAGLGPITAYLFGKKIGAKVLERGGGEA